MFRCGRSTFGQTLFRRFLDFILDCLALIMTMGDSLDNYKFLLMVAIDLSLISAVIFSTLQQLSDILNCKPIY